MQSSDFTKSATDPDLWQRKSEQLRLSAAVLWDKVEAIKQSVPPKDNAGERTAALTELIGFMQSAQLLDALAIETQLKHALIVVSPKDVHLKVDIDGDGEVRSAEVMAIGVPMKDGHNLVLLAKRLGLLENPSHDKLEQFFCFARSCIEWRGRYPTSRKSADLLNGTELDASTKLLGFRSMAADIQDRIQQVIDTAK